MIYSIGSVHTWQVLRAILRAETAGQPPFGRELRITPTRKNKDGTFLDELVKEGLIEVAAPPEPRGKSVSSSDAHEPVQFRTRYRLTELGRHAAEYGEYDRPHTPAPVALFGLAAELAATIAHTRDGWMKPKPREEAAKPKPKRKGK